jgi:L-lactate dehydrogenase complex protein LldG
VSRERVLERIRAALGAAAGQSRAGAIPVAMLVSETVPASVGIPVPPDLPEPQAMADPVSVFVDRARQLTMIAEVVPSVEDAAARTAAWCAERGVRRAAVWNVADIAPITDRLRATGVEIHPPGDPLAAVAGADVGITGAEWGIAESATLVLSTDPDRPRLVSLLPPTHVAIVRADRVVSDLHALFERVGSLPSALTLITGPSRSADIGLVPVLGAHGPMAVAVFVIP